MIYGKYVKRIMDFILASIALVMLSFIMLIVAFLVRIKLGSPVIFKQERPGLNEKKFTLYKFRTMTDEKMKMVNYCLITLDLRNLENFKIYFLDELPELFNILKGDMSFIGPRPLLVEYLPLYNEHQKRGIM